MIKADDGDGHTDTVTVEIGVAAPTSTPTSTPTPPGFEAVFAHFLEKRKPVLKEKLRKYFLVKVFTKPLQGLRGRGAEPHEGKKVVGKAFFFKERFAIAYLVLRRRK